MAGLRIRVFGGVHVADGVRDLVIEPSCRPLLGYLLAHRGGPVARRELAETVWCNREREYALRCLSTALWRLKRSTGSGLLALNGEGDVALNWQRAAWVDCIAFERRVASLLRRAPLTLGETDRARLARGLRCYSGDFLAGIDAEWALLERQRLRALYIHGLHLMMLASAEHGQWAEALRWGQRLSDEEPLREDVYRVLMHAHTHLGNRAVALALYRRCERTLRAELGVAPMRETQALYRELAAGDAAAPVPAAGDGAAPSAAAQAVPRAAQRIRRVQRALAASHRQLDQALADIDPDATVRHR